MGVAIIPCDPRGIDLHECACFCVCVIQVVHLEHVYIGWLTDHHTFKSFALWCFGFVTFILSLEKSTYKYQFTQFGMDVSTLAHTHARAHTHTHTHTRAHTHTHMRARTHTHAHTQPREAKRSVVLSLWAEV